MGDGNFQWWASAGKEPESYQGPFDTRDEAVAQMLAEDGRVEGYTIIEADKAVARSDIFDAGRIFEDYEERNIECWGEDDAEFNVTREQELDLEKMLTETLDAWFKKHGCKPREWCFDEMRNHQFVPPETATQTQC